MLAPEGLRPYPPDGGGMIEPGKSGVALQDHRISADFQSLFENPVQSRFYG
jgi:hypothetical protein